MCCRAVCAGLSKAASKRYFKEEVCRVHFLVSSSDRSWMGWKFLKAVSVPLRLLPCATWLQGLTFFMSELFNLLILKAMP